MKCNFIHIKLKDKNNFNLNKDKIFELFKLSIENNANRLSYNKNEKISTNQNLEFIV